MKSKAFISNFWDHCHLLCSNHADSENEYPMKLNENGDYECSKCQNKIDIYKFEKVMDKMMKMMVDDDLNDIICNYTGAKIKISNETYRIKKHIRNDFWILIPLNREG